MVIIYPKHDVKFWGSVEYLSHLAAELMDAELIECDFRAKPTRLEQLSCMFGRRRGDETCLIICPDSTDCGLIAKIPGINRRVSRISAWIIDSFRPEWVDRMTRWSRLYDHIYVTREDDIQAWGKMMGVPVTHLPFGSDVWRFGSGGGNREVDLMRFGRQPREWSDNQATESACAKVGLRFGGPPPFFNKCDEGQKAIHDAYAKSKFVLTFSNLADPASYTHPTRPYLTARWFDALASGTTIAGIAPRSPEIDRTLWPGSILELPGISMSDGLPLIREAVSKWRPEQAAFNYRMALERFDWRWRLAVIADDLGLPAPRLGAELKAIQNALAIPSPFPAPPPAVPTSR